MRTIFRPKCTRLQCFAYTFSKIYRGNTRGPPQRPRCLDPDANFRLARQRSNCFFVTKRLLELTLRLPYVYHACYSNALFGEQCLFALRNLHRICVILWSSRRTSTSRRTSAGKLRCRILRSCRIESTGTSWTPSTDAHSLCQRYGHH